MPRKQGFASNWQRKPRVADKLGTYRFTGATMSDDLSTLNLADGTAITVGDHVYVVSSPGKPFSLGRVLGFVADSEQGPVETRYMCRINWLYRPASVNKKPKNTREVYLTMHCDLVALNLLRGRLQVESRELVDIDNLPPNCFWFEKFWDPYIFKLYDALPTAQISNIPPSLGPYIRERYSHLIVEPAFARLLLEAPIFCETCDMWCSLDDSVRCSVCDKTFHRCCTSPPIVQPLKARWCCESCTQDMELRQEQQRGPDLTMRRKRSPLSIEKQQEKDEKDALKAIQVREAEEKATKADQEFLDAFVPHYKVYEKELAEQPHPERSVVWPFRHVGLEVTVQDIFDSVGRTQPHASSRVGPKNQVTVQPWSGQPVQYYRKIYAERKKRAKNKSAVIGYEPDLDRSLPWVREAPSGYIERGSDATSFKIWGGGDADSYLTKCASYAETIGMSARTSNFIDACLYEYMTSKNELAALEKVGRLDKKSLKEPELTPLEVELFEESVKQHGNNLHAAYKHVKTKSSADIVRFYYLWKKTEAGHAIWDNCAARASRQASTIDDEFLLRIAGGADPELNFSLDAVNDTFDTVKCHFCLTESSKEWRKAPGVVVEEGQSHLEALCSRCSRLWYRYGVVWSAPQAVLEMKQPDPELLEDAQSILAEMDKFEQKPKALQRKTRARAKPTTPRKSKKARLESEEPVDEDVTSASPEIKADTDEADAEAEVTPEATPEPTPQPEAMASSVPPAEEPSVKDESEYEHEAEADTLHEDSSPSPSLSPQSEDHVRASPNYCMVCCQHDPTLPQLTCSACALSVHPFCYGFVDQVQAKEWHCDCCLNDKDHQANHLYQCDLCPVKLPNYVAWLAGQETDVPDALKRTWDNHWAHVRCAIWSPGVKFERPELLQQVELYPHHAEMCTLCNAHGRCVSCAECSATFHPGCAGARGYTMGFKFEPVGAVEGAHAGTGAAAGVPAGAAHITADPATEANIDPSGASRTCSESPPDDEKLVTYLGQQGRLTPQILCPEHDSDLLSMCEIDDDQNKTLLQIYAAGYKDAGQPHITSGLRRALLLPSKAAKVQIEIPIEFAKGKRGYDPLDFVKMNPRSCSLCRVQDALYWVRDGDTVHCCGCYWESRDSTEHVNHDNILQHLGRVFDEAVPLMPKASAAAPTPAPAPAPVVVPKVEPKREPTPPPPSMKIKDILS